MPPTSPDTDRCASCFRLIMLALVVVMCVRASAVADWPALNKIDWSVANDD